MPAAASAPLFEHVRELRRRLLWSLTFVIVGAGIGYVLYEKLLYLLQLPYGKELYYTAPTGALSFLIKVCLTFGFVVGLPMIVYQLLAFIAPVAKMQTRRIIALYLFTSVALALLGISFAYFVSLPAALHFLVNFGNPDTVQALITANEYFNFVLSYLAGFAVLFQIPLLIMGINRITPLKPRKLLGGFKYAVLLSFIVAAILTPTPDPVNQTIMAGPIVILYLLSVGLVAVFGRKRRAAVAAPAVELAPDPDPEPVVTPSPVTPPVAAVAARPRPTMSDIIRPSQPAASPAPSTAARQVSPQSMPNNPNPLYRVQRSIDGITPA